MRTKEGREIKHNTNEYRNLHARFRRKHGKANGCENEFCDGKSKRFDWAIRPGRQYSINRGDYRMLCRTCHMLQDARRGEAHRNSKLTAEAVAFIRANKGKITQNEMAKMFGVIRQTISLVVLNKNWNQQEKSSLK